MNITSKSQKIHMIKKHHCATDPVDYRRLSYVSVYGKKEACNVCLLPTCWVCSVIQCG